MGEVYKARDTRLDRVVAIKVLPAHVAADPIRRERFEREARVISQLNHPHICTLYDVGHDGDVDYLVIEYLEGQTLAERLPRSKDRALPVAEALEIAIQIADALDAAHRRGIIHRDLKPANVMLTKTGAKLLDFGIAKAVGPPGNRGVRLQPDVTAVPTIPPTLTADGTLLGTVQYMAPEQLEGREADARSDLFAFGAMLYEMLTGRRAFAGESQASVIAAILEIDPPPIGTAQPLTPPALDRVVRKCLAKDPEARWQTARDLVDELKWIDKSANTPEVAVARQRSRLTPGGWMVAGIAVLAATGFIAIGGYFGVAPLSFLASRERQLVRFSIDPLLMNPPFELAVSPDGRNVAFVASVPGGPSMVYLRAIDSVTARPLPGTENGDFPFWSPDSRYIAFGQGSQLKKVEVAGGSPQSVCDLPGTWAGGAWSSDDVIVLSLRNELYRVSAAGGEPVQATTLDKTRAETAHYWPSFLPDGRHYMYLAWSSRPENRAVFAGSLDSQNRELVMPAEYKATYASPGYLIFMREAALMAQPFDAGRLKLSGEPVRLAEDVISGALQHRGAFSVSGGAGENTLVYRSDPGTSGTKLTLTWVDRAGTVLGTFGPPDGPWGLDLSPDEKRVMIHRHEGGGGDIWNADLSGGETLRVTFDPAQDNGSPLWSPDGDYVVFGSRRKGKWGLYKKLANGTGAEELLVESDQNIISPTSWSRDGHFILYWENPTMAVGGDVWALPLTGERKAYPLLQTKFGESNSQISPDGKWFAYLSNESGRIQVYVQSFPPGKGKWMISQNGGYASRWRADGKELFFMDACCFGKIMSAEISFSGSTLVRSTPRPLFDSGFNSIAMAARSHTGRSNPYAVSRDGQRFLIPRSDAPNGNPPITVVLNWTALLKKETGSTAQWSRAPIEPRP